VGREPPTPRPSINSRRLVVSGRPKLSGPALAGVAALVLCVCGACAGGAPSALDSHGPDADRIAGLWWFMFVVSAVVVAVVAVLLGLGVGPRRRRRYAPRDTPRWANRTVLLGGVVVPVLVLAVLWVLTLRDIRAVSATRDGAMTVQVIGHDWWWEVRYPGQGVVTANDIHVPAGRPVRLLLTTGDVLHSFWVPQLAGKTDLVPGKTNLMWIQADRPGVYRGQCAEFCGLQHAHMAFTVVAQSAAGFATWVSVERATPAAPTDPTLAQGLEVFTAGSCAECHTIRGTSAEGTDGPDLTHFGSRLSIGAGTVPNTRGNLGGWIVDSQSIKPGNLMPPIQLAPGDLQALLDYLGSLR
jgi:cytochrome c oxidase subunit 2